MDLNTTNLCELDTPLGPITARLDASGAVQSLRFAAGPGPEKMSAIAADKLSAQLREYFSGERRDFDLPLAPAGTEFQKKVWAELRRIPYGQTISYLELAERIGDPKAVRAVARANALNPIAILIPCHRVIGSDGSLTGYAYGLDRKAGLLALEGVAVNPSGQIALFA